MINRVQAEKISSHKTAEFNEDDMSIFQQKGDTRLLKTYTEK